MQQAYFNAVMPMKIFPSTIQEFKSEEKDAAADSTQQSSTLTLVTLSSPLTPIDAVEFSTPHEPPCWRSLRLDSDEKMNALCAFDDVFYNSDDNGPPKATEADSFHNEKAIL